MYIYVCIYMYICICIYIYIHTHVYVHVHIRVRGWCPERTIESLCTVAGGPGPPKSFFLLSSFLRRGARASAREICLGTTLGGGPGLGSEWAQGGLGGLLVGFWWAFGRLLVGFWWAFGGLLVGFLWAFGGLLVGF